MITARSGDLSAPGRTPKHGTEPLGLWSSTSCQRTLQGSGLQFCDVMIRVGVLSLISDRSASELHLVGGPYPANACLAS
jgi:hypothetical protein